MNDHEARILLEKYLKDEATAAERQQLFAAISSDAALLGRIIEQVPIDFSQTAELSAETKQDILTAILNATKPIAVPQQAAYAHRVHFLKKAWLRYAAAAILICAAGAYYWYHADTGRSTPAGTEAVSLNGDIAPGHDGAILTLADGTQIVLDSMHNGLIARQNGTQVVLQNGQLTYGKSDVPPREIVYNTMHTPKGRQFKVVLPDGTGVWLNAASTIRYPTVFAGKERLVELEGEAYFEVAPDKALPFRVRVNDRAVIEVLGTSFNINAYENESAIKTTLAEGRLRVQLGERSVVLEPGQQAAADRHNQLSVRTIAVHSALAWKNGFFNMDNADVTVLMRQLERWYGIEVVLEGPAPSLRFTGNIHRNVSLSAVLQYLRRMGIAAKLEGNTLTVGTRMNE